MLAGGVISVQVLNEVAFGLGWPEIAAVIADIRTALDPVRPIGVETHEAALMLAAANGFGFHDALIVAAALESGATGS